MKILTGLFATLLLGTTALAAADVKPRVIVVSDIGNEPDDSESFVRFLLYTNQLDAEGFVASTSTWQRDIIHPELFRERIEAYGKVLKNLRAHDKAYPDAAKLMALVKNGQPHYGIAHVGEGFDTEGSDWIIAQADKPDPRPLWVVNWGGSADLAQALYKVKKTRTPERLKAFIAKLRVYSISDQDDAGPWARANFPELFWIASIHAFSQYESATWTGISSEVHDDPKAEHMTGPDTRLVTNAWLDAHIRKGPLGALYPQHIWIMEGDTPSFLNLISRGLSDPEHPEWGGWGGRYGKMAPQWGLYSNTPDTAVGVDGKTYHTSQASIWRWRAAFQNDFAARINWTLTDKFSGANHAPKAVLNGDTGFAPLQLRAKYGEAVKFSAEGSSDPDKNTLSYKWWIYKDANSPSVEPVLTEVDPQHASLVVPKPASGWPGEGPEREIHVILEVTDNGTPSLVSYRHAVVTAGP
ncbi:hypothetical protein FHS83_001641 [Rhizomicrobium palustre]|uniref:DUF1593 domain-containing protein n=1 Tax=Rhizomicrobium palustre TaxID=189966 RepID=A0A846MYF6_9PROT|nr:nucleoside hydrolase-like domain-containing protein [Rhizomicrobium palustre]NIK88323.1 hypothetical protein [Rhizomicrobium palustre]